MTKQVRLACIASGNGSDFESIAKAWLAGWLPEVKSLVLIATSEKDKDGDILGCIQKAKERSILYKVVEPENTVLMPAALEDAFSELGGADLVFLVGCLVTVPQVRPMYNIHPADPQEHGGKGMYGLAVHMHVLDAINDQYQRGMVSLNNRIFTTPTVHEVTDEYDKGKELVRVQVEIPYEILKAFLTGNFEVGNFEVLAEKLQKIVLPYEWLMLPAAVRMAAKKILDKNAKKGGHNDSNTAK
ncbi:hypothetical protein ACFL2U_01380 [Patescibacteria group bacterium]